MSSLGIFDKETKTYKKVADLSKPAVIDSAMSDTSTNPVQNKVVKSYVDETFKQKLITARIGDSETLYLRLCTIKINGDWLNYPIEITVQERGRDALDKLTVLFENSYSFDPNLTSFKVFGGFDGWYISKTAASTWAIYGEKSESWAEIRVVDYIGFDNINVTWDITGVTSLPDSKTKAVWGGNVSHAVSADRANSALTVTNVDSAMSDTSTNPIQNKVVKSYVDNGLNTLKKSVSDGKTKVANAITDKGIETATDATFDVMAENISKIETGGGELHGATLAVSTEESTLFGQTVTLTLNGASVGSTVFADNGTCSFVVQNPGTYTITCGEAHKDVTVTGDNVLNKTVISVELSLTLLKIVAFATGTDEEIAAMIQAHYNNKINIADYWAVGDTRSVSLFAMSATGVRESHRAQTVQFIIGDFEHDDLATPINGHSKAAITLLQKDCLMNATSASMAYNGSNDTERGYMNSTNTNLGGWKNCARRAWCNNVFFAALPSVWQSIVKTVNKKTSIGNGSSTIETVQDKIFLAAEIEIFGSTTYSFAGEGTQYQYYKNATANRYKMPKWNSKSVSQIYWERSPRSGYTTSFCNVDYNGEAYDREKASEAWGVAPCLCI